MKVEKFQTNLPLVDQQGNGTPITNIALAKLVAEVMALRLKVDDYEARLTGGGL